MKTLTILIPILSVLFLTGCKDQIPSTKQINLSIPEQVRTCKYKPRSPGRSATEKQRARYIIKLYYAWENCHGNLAAVNGMYKRYRKALHRIANEK